ncbi:MAG: DUF1569 domain-containing protein [Cytophagaceae bacterium]|nr:DUF1569 domain-containing protein [Cytophagaceae bacterium]MDW8455492.1 DUF1569 domain-containing protein [Cytophagaceae bacterium]
MRTQKLYHQKFLPIAKYLIKELEYYGENQFRRQTKVSEWSIGQLFDHLIRGSYEFHLAAIRKCLSGENSSGRKNITLKGFFVLNFGYPPFKIKKLESPYVPVQPEKPSVVLDQMYAFTKEMQRIAIEIDKSNNKNNRAEHPAFGALNPYQWYKLIVLHYKHHLLQKKRIDKIIKTVSKKELLSQNAETADML